MYKTARFSYLFLCSAGWDMLFKLKYNAEVVLHLAYSQPSYLPFFSASMGFSPVDHLVVLSYCWKYVYNWIPKFKPVLFKCSYVYEEIYVYEESLALYDM